ncbi:hypothetical protein ACFZBP_11580 [Streptomyces sp. NPDC008086]|uniref:hypothetical protein n=1 Tax=Streptomyces sp. NPDC008086 TaxID=3364807 RepID=UPI0036E77EA0
MPKAGGARKGTDTVRLFLSGGINKITVTGTSGALVLDRLRVARSEGTLKTTVYQAEKGTHALRGGQGDRRPHLYHQYDQRSPYAPVIDQVAVTPLAAL